MKLPDESSFNRLSVHSLRVETHNHKLPVIVAIKNYSDHQTSALKSELERITRLLEAAKKQQWSMWSASGEKCDEAWKGFKQANNIQ